MKRPGVRYLHFLLASAGGVALAYMPGSFIAMVTAMPGCWCPVKSHWGTARGLAVFVLLAAAGFWLIGRYRPLRASFGQSVLWVSIACVPAAVVWLVPGRGTTSDLRVVLAAAVLIITTIGYVPFRRPLET